MKQTKMVFPWDSVTRISGPLIGSNPQMLLQKPKLIESDIRGELKRHFRKPDAPPQGQPGYQILKTSEYLVVNVPNSQTTPKRNLSVWTNSRRIRLQGLPGSIKILIALSALVISRLTQASFKYRELRIANAASAHDTSRSNCPKDELYA